MDGALWYLKRCDLFELLTPEQAARLNRNALARTFKRRELVYSPTEPGETVLVLAGGRVKIKDLTADGKETILTFIEEGELFGELALLDEEPRREYAEAVEESRVLALQREDLLAVMEARSDLALSITKLIGLRRRRIENRLRNVLFLPARERMLRLLGELGEAYGERAGAGRELRLSLSHQDFASLVGITRETVTVLLGEFQAEGLLKLQRCRVTILDWARLHRGSDAAFVRPPPAPARPGPLA